VAVKKYTELDFAQVKQNLKDFLKGQPEFQDFNFEGSGINILLDVLAYNTSYNAFYSNMIANEMFLDTANLRNNVVSRAKALGYVPTSVRAPYATIGLTVTLPFNNTNPENIILPLFSRFGARVGNDILLFHTMERFVIPKISTSASEEVYYSPVKIYQTEKLVHKFVIDEELFPGQRFILPNENIDSTKIFISIKKTPTSVSGEPWLLADDVTTISGDDKVYWAQEADRQHLEIYFGDNFIGKKPENGNEITVTYFTTSGPKYHGINKFVSESLITPSGLLIAPQFIRLTTIEDTRSGSDLESVETIKLRAPQYYDTQSRAVTKNDYETLLLKDYPQIEHVRVWGGEENSPPKYGVVFISAKPRNALTFNVLEKESIVNTVIRPRNMVSIEVEIVDPEYMNIVIDSLVKYESRKNNKSPGEIESAVRKSIDTYAKEALSGFDSDFRYSALVSHIDEADSSINGNITKLQLKYAITPPINVNRGIKFSFQAPLSFGDVLHDVRSVRSSSFIYNGFETFIADDGNGNLFSFRNFGNSKIIVEPNIGVVDYATGDINIPSLTVQGIANGGINIYFYAMPAENDFFAKRNRILLIDQNDVKIRIKDENR
jgi:hypothetical protein